MIGPTPRDRDRLLRYLVGLAIAVGLLAINYPTVKSWAVDSLRSYQINSEGYKADKGHWAPLVVPQEFRVNAIHAVLLYTGKVLIVAGSGNNRKQFEAGHFKSLLWDPSNNSFKMVHTPSDLFCAGHAFLPDGKVLIAGGTKRYEVLAQDVKNAAGVMTIKNESPNGSALTLRKGTIFTSSEGVEYRSTEDVTVAPAAKVVAATGRTTVTASSKEVWVEAVQRGKGYAVNHPDQYSIEGIDAARSHNVYGYAQALTMDKQEFGGDDKSYLFDPATEKYERVDNMTLKRWYPTLVGLEDGRVLSVSGLDEYGRIIEGDNEIYDPATKKWRNAPELKRTFPTYPALFLMPGGNLFYSGSNAGYGSDKVGRIPGIWNLSDNTFRAVPGLRDPRETETSGSVLLPPAQTQRYMLAGGGGIGDAPTSTARTDVVDLTNPEPHFQPGPDLLKPTRYPGMVVTPDDRVVITGGSSGYRGEHDSNLLICTLYDPKTNSLKRMADPTVGRNYHSEALLLPDGRIITLGSDPLYGNKEDTVPGTFEQRIEVYSPPYLFSGNRPVISGGPREVSLGSTVRFDTPDAMSIATARLIRPSAVTHVTDVEQRSIALEVSRHPGGVDVTIPKSRGLVPAGWYMLFVTDNEHGTPSVARWVKVD